MAVSGGLSVICSFNWTDGLHLLCATTDIQFYVFLFNKPFLRVRVTYIHIFYIYYIHIFAVYPSYCRQLPSNGIIMVIRFKYIILALKFLCILRLQEIVTSEGCIVVDI